MSGGTAITIAGYVLTRDCKPVSKALIELWHCDDHGEYDNAGYRLRGHQFSDDQGRWWFETILPGVYPGRTRHFHVKVQRPGGPVLTTQLYFPGEAGNDSDGIFDPSLLLVDQGCAGRRLRPIRFHRRLRRSGRRGYFSQSGIESSPMRSS